MSVIGGFVGIAVLAIAAPMVSELALMFSPRDYLLLAVMGLLLVGGLTGDSMAKGVFAAAIGVGIGALPGAGGDIAALMAYDHARRSTKNPSRPFGQGAYEGVVAPESANNASVGGAYIPMMTLGIPGDAVTAVIIGAMFIHGLRPGPLLMTETPDLFWFIVGSLVLANIFLLIFGMTGIRIFAKVVETPKAFLLPVILILSAVGAYAINNNPVDVYWMLGFGVLGYLMKIYGFPVAPVILGIVLGPLLERSYRQSILMTGEDPVLFVTEFFTSPISVILLLALGFSLLVSTPWWKRWRSRGK